MYEKNVVYENQKELEKKHKRRVKSLLARVGLLAMLLIVSTYAWFTSQKDITLSNIRGTVEVVENMEISLDAKTWYQKIDLSDAINSFAEAQQSRDETLNETDTKSTALAIVPEQLFPVSGAGKIGETLLPLYKGEATSTSLTGIDVCAEETVISGVDTAVDNGYIAFDIYIKNTSRDNEKDILQLNINSSAQVLTETINKTITDITGNRVTRDYYGNDASGLQNTIRVALAKYEGEISSTATQLEILNSTKGANIADVAIWEPNAYDHVESIVSNNNKLINASNSNKIEFTAYHPETALETYALTEESLVSGAAQGKIENVYNIASAGLGVQNTFKTDNIKNSTTKIIESYRIKTEDNKPLNIKNTSNNYFEISSNAVTRYRVYVWLEGQDIDCINIASLGGGIELDLGLTKDDEIGEVLNSDNRINYSTQESTNESVTATITLEKEIIELPEGWEYADATNKVIQKEYFVNTTEQVEIKDENGKITKIEVDINNIDTFASLIVRNEGSMYGEYTNYPIDIDGDSTNNDWQIFYVGESNAFLIPDDYLHRTNITNNEMTLNTSGTSYNFGATFGEEQLTTTTISEEIAKKYLLTKAVQTTNYNYYATAHLLNTSKWTNFVDATYAESAVGGPTMEMFADSWNTKFYNREGYGKITWEWSNDTEGVRVPGYKVGNLLENRYAIKVSGHDTEEAKMYWPYTTYINIDGTSQGECYGYWLASPSAGAENLVMAITSDSYVNNADYTNRSVAVRPVVCLKPDVQAIEVDGVWELSIE